ncbi:MAG: hypothetical protein ACLPVP_09730, partial [Methanoregula sp.]
MDDTHNTTVVIQDYNTWADQQGAYYSQVSSAITQIGNTVDSYNRDTAAPSSDPVALRGDVVADQQVIGQWGAASTELESTTDTFSSATSSLTVGNDPDTLQLT